MHGDILKFRRPDSLSLLLKLQISIVKKISTTNVIFSFTGSKEVLVLFSYPMVTVCSTHSFFAFLLLHFQ